MEKEALDHTEWETRFGRGHGPVGRQTNELINDVTVVNTNNMRRPAIHKPQCRYADV
jgi:hypothetical protein